MCCEDHDWDTSVTHRFNPLLTRLTLGVPPHNHSAVLVQPMKYTLSNPAHQPQTPCTKSDDSSTKPLVPEGNVNSGQQPRAPVNKARSGAGKRCAFVCSHRNERRLKRHQMVVVRRLNLCKLQSQDKHVREHRHGPVVVPSVGPENQPQSPWC
jgi:hypothetical protein